MARMQTLSIIGAGRLGKTLGRLWAEQRVFSLADVMCQSIANAEDAALFIGAGRAVKTVTSLHAADVYLLATPDDKIASGCEALAATGLLTSTSIVFHCSGALPSTVLQPAIDRGATVASIHPIKSFAEPIEAVKTFAGTWCGMEGDARALEVLASAFEAIGARLAAIDTAAKVHYHAAAVFGSNYLVTLIDVAVQSYARAGIAPEVALQMLAPLMRGTLENALRLGPARALTGPIARGDLATAERQHQAVADMNVAHGELYRQFMQLTKELAARRDAE